MTIQFATGWLLATCLTLSLLSCASVPTHKPIAPEVTLESVKLASFGLREQELAFRLNVFNPNKYILPVSSLDFVASYQGTPLAKGSNIDTFKLAAGDSTELDMLVKTKISKVLGELLKATANNEQLLDIDIEGSIKLDNWPVRIPFDVDRRISNPALRE